MRLHHPSKEIKITAKNEKCGIQSITLPDGETKNSDTVTFKVTEDGEYPFIIVDRNGKSKTEVVSVSNIKEKFNMGISIEDFSFYNNPGGQLFVGYHDCWYRENVLVLYAKYYDVSSTEYGNMVKGARGIVPQNVEGYSKLNLVWNWYSYYMVHSSEAKAYVTVGSRSSKKVYDDDKSAGTNITSVDLGEPDSRFYFSVSSGGIRNQNAQACISVSELYLSP